jgi:hypothetical protein
MRVPVRDGRLQRARFGQSSQAGGSLKPPQESRRQRPLKIAPASLCDADRSDRSSPTGPESPH